MAIGGTLFRRIISVFGNGPGTELLNHLNAAGADGTSEVNAITPSGGTLTVTGNEVVTGNVTAANFVTAGGVAIGSAGSAGSYFQLATRVPGIADNTATAVFEFAIPAGNQAAAFRVLLMATMTGSTDSFESTRVAAGTGVINRKTGLDAIAQVSALTGAQIATSGDGTITLAYSITTPTVGAGATDCQLRVTIVKTGTVTDHECVAFIELLNSQGSGITVGTP
jgi:hypothetical protein